MIEFDAQIIPTARAMSFSFLDVFGFQGCVKSFSLPECNHGFDRQAILLVELVYLVI